MKKTRLNTLWLLSASSQKKYKLSEKEAFNYLDRFKAVDFLERQYNIAHTLSFSQMVSDVAFFCRKNGGGL
ncbi:DUF3791 domain-containing protein [Treponema berlinense]|uniref:DUF3791 domain-containing protein n=1 Tax=Treponema berlinense TaxID=225004 RepID=UPI0023F6E316|nr:DUF3791 domain-containing protein [Treponema berlinense]